MKIVGLVLLARDLVGRQGSLRATGGGAKTQRRGFLCELVSLSRLILKMK